MRGGLAKTFGHRLAARDFGWLCTYCYRILDPVVRYEQGWTNRETGITHFRAIQHVDMPCVDHVVPVSRGGPEHIDNYVLSCKSCNSRKRDRLPGEF
jgi:HNH endonuclease